jgi:hypothetical protein
MRTRPEICRVVAPTPHGHGHGHGKYAVTMTRRHHGSLGLPSVICTMFTRARSRRYVME